MDANDKSGTDTFVDAVVFSHWNNEVITHMTKKDGKPQYPKKDRHPFSLGFFTIGTVCKVQVSRYAHPEPIEVTVKKLAKNGPDSYVFLTGEYSGVTECEVGFNIDHVVEIVKHVPGLIVIAPDKDSEKKRQWLFENRFSRNNCAENLSKCSAKYVTTAPIRLVCLLATKFEKYDQVVDYDKLLDLLIKRGNFKIVDKVHCDFYIANKKKLRKAIKQLINKALVSPAKAQKEEDASWNSVSSVYDD